MSSDCLRSVEGPLAQVQALAALRQQLVGEVRKLAKRELSNVEEFHHLRREATRRGDPCPAVTSYCDECHTGAVDARERLRVRVRGVEQMRLARDENMALIQALGEVQAPGSPPHSAVATRLEGARARVDQARAYIQQQSCASNGAVLDLLSELQALDRVRARLADEVAQLRSRAEGAAAKRTQLEAFVEVGLRRNMKAGLQYEEVE